MGIARISRVLSPACIWWDHPVSHPAAGAVAARRGRGGSPTRWPGGRRRRGRSPRRPASFRLRVGVHPNEPVGAQRLIAVPPVGAQKPAVRHAVVQARHVRCQRRRSLGHQPVVTEEHRRGVGRLPDGVKRFLSQSGAGGDVVLRRRNLQAHGDRPIRLSARRAAWTVRTGRGA